MQHQREYVGIDLHRRRSVIVRRSGDGETISTVRISNDPLVLAAEVSKAGPHPIVVLEATYGWYWAADILAELGAEVHLAHPLGNNWGHRRVKNDERDATDLIDLCRMGRLAEAWIAPPEFRELRELVRYRHKLVELRSNLKAQVHGVLAKEGVAVHLTDLFGEAGRIVLDTSHLAPVYRMRVESLRRLISELSSQVRILDEQIDATARRFPGYQTIQVIPGVGPVLAAVFVAEIGDVTRFKTPSQLASWAGLTPRHRESDTTVRRGHITKQGSRILRWAAIEAVARQRTSSILATHRDRVAGRRGPRIGRVAAARKLLTLVFYGLRDGEIRCLSDRG